MSHFEALPDEVRQNVRSPLSMSARRSPGRLRICLSRITTTQALRPASGSQTSSRVSGRMCWQDG